MKYQIMLRLPIGKVLDKFGKLEDSFNQTMSEIGFSEKMMTTALFPFVLTVPDDTSQEDLDKCRQAILDGLKEKLGYAKIESFERVVE